MGEAGNCLFVMSHYRTPDWFIHSTIHLINGEKMKKNMGNIDRTVRTVIALAIGILYFTGAISGTTAIILGVLAIVFLLTSLVGTCPLYMPVGLSTKKGAK